MTVQVVSQNHMSHAHATYCAADVMQLPIYFPPKKPVSKDKDVLPLKQNLTRGSHDLLTSAYVKSQQHC